LPTLFFQKTLQTISLILSHPPDGYRYGKSDGDDIDAGICTLIVCPKSVISNWLQQIDDFVEENTFRVKVYEGTPKQRAKICGAVMENQVDILLSSYETIAAEFEREKKSTMGNDIENVHQVAFYRIV
jgi:SNF2 family DNA or RNA helicase